MTEQPPKINVCISADVTIPANPLPESRPVKIALNDSPAEIKAGDVVYCSVSDSTAVVEQVERDGVVVYERGDR